MTELTHAALAVFLALIGLATVAALVSRNSNTSGVATSLFGGLSTAIRAADAPITGDSGGLSLGSYGGLTGVGFPQG